MYDETTFEMLPAEVKKQIEKEDLIFDQLITSVATIHVIESKGGEVQKLAELDFDFGEVADVKKYYDTMSKLSIDIDSGLVSLGIIDELDSSNSLAAEKTHRGIITTGITAQRSTSSSYKYYYQLQGWWDWLDSGWMSSLDRLGIKWGREFSSNESTHHAYSTTYSSSPKTTTISKLPYRRNANLENKGVMWKHNTTLRTHGSAVAQVYHRSDFKGMTWPVTFEYVTPTFSTNDNSWVALAANVFFSYLGVYIPPANRYGVTTSITLP